MVVRQRHRDVRNRLHKLKQMVEGELETKEKQDSIEGKIAADGLGVNDSQDDHQTSRNFLSQQRSTDRSASRFERERQAEQSAKRHRRNRFLDRKLEGGVSGRASHVSVSCNSSIFNAELDDEVEREIQYEMEKDRLERTWIGEKQELQDQPEKKTQSQLAVMDAN